MSDDQGTGVPAGRKRTNHAGGNRPETREHFARLRYIAIAGRLRQGASRREVADEFDVCLCVVNSARLAVGIPSDKGRPGQPKPWLRKDGPSERVLERLRMVASGMAYVDVAHATGVSRQAIACDVRRWPDELERLKWEALG